MNKKSICLAIQYTVYVLILLGIIFLVATMLWISISPYTIQQFKIVFSKVLKNAGSYSVLLVGVVITTFFQIYSKEKELEKEDKIKVGEVGYYILTFPGADAEYNGEWPGDKMVVEIRGEDDYDFSASNGGSKYFYFFSEILTSKKESSNLKNIMAFGDEYFKSNKKKILKNYYKYCEKITYLSPLYCSAKPTKEINGDGVVDKNRYFWLYLDVSEPDITKIFWISAVTEEGILLFIKVKVRFERKNDQKNDQIYLMLLQQTTYFKSQNKLCALYR